MYAVIETGGKQYRVEVGTELEVEHLEVEAGQAITLDRVLLVADGAEASIGRPLVADAVVSAEVLRQDRGPKLISFKYRPKARSRVKKGHRQELTVLRVTDVRLGGRSAADDARKAESERQSERERLEEVAARQAAADQALAAKLAADAPAAPAAPEAPATTRRSRKAADTTDATPAATTGAATTGAEDAAPGPLSVDADADPGVAEMDGTESTESTGSTESTDKPARTPRTKKES
jgi:large subunit ribosomal protein L21